MFDKDVDQLFAELDTIHAVVLRAEAIDEIKAIRGRAGAIRVLAQAMRLGLELANRAAEVKLIAERRGGAILAESFPHGGDRKSELCENVPTLSAAGVTRNESARWRLEASVDEAAFRHYVQVANARSARITAAGLRRLARGEPPFPPDSQAEAPGIREEPDVECECDGRRVTNRSRSGDPRTDLGDGNAMCSELDADTSLPRRTEVRSVGQQLDEL